MYDVIIAGAGPAGSTCARECARQGMKTLLLDKDSFPRAKPCGGAVSAHALSLLDFSLPESIIERECRGIRIVYGKRSLEVRKDTRFAVLISRIDFDALLADKAKESGARFIPAEPVIDVRIGQDVVTAVTRTSSYQAPFLIGADGINSRIAQLIRPPFPKEEMSLALVSHVPADEGSIRDNLGTNLYLHFGVVPMGYGWLFPHRGYYSAGMAGLASKFEHSRDKLHEFARSLNIDLTEIQGRFIPFGGLHRPIAKGRILLTGDAAGFADPFHGEGIVHAILSGRLAAQSVADAVKNRRDPAAARSRYCQEAELQITRNLRIALRLATVIEKYPGIFLHIFFDHPEALERYLDIPSGQIDYRQFQRWFLAHLPLLLLPGKRTYLAPGQEAR